MDSARAQEYAARRNWGGPPSRATSRWCRTAHHAAVVHSVLGARHPPTHPPAHPTAPSPAASPSKLSLNYFDNERGLGGGDSILVDGYNQVGARLLQLRKRWAPGRKQHGAAVRQPRAGSP